MAKTALPPSAPPSDEVDDYMSMTIIEPKQPLEKETYTQRRKRKEREAEARSRSKSKAELAAAADNARNDALTTALPDTSKGFQMMAKLGFKPGSALGAPANSNARTEPLNIAVKEDRGGVGMENEKKRKIREKAGEFEKKQKVEEGDYRERVGKEREEKRLDGLSRGAMKVLEGLERSEIEAKLPTSRINVLWRNLVREREITERERRMRHDFHQSLSRNAAYEDHEDNEQEKQAFGNEEADVEEEDEELIDFLLLDGKDRLRRLVEYLRAEHYYCFWCKSKFDTEQLEGCPGVEEDDHD